MQICGCGTIFPTHIKIGDSEYLTYTENLVNTEEEITFTNANTFAGNNQILTDINNHLSGDLDITKHILSDII